MNIIKLQYKIKNTTTDFIEKKYATKDFNHLKPNKIFVFRQKILNI